LSLVVEPSALSTACDTCVRSNAYRSSSDKRVARHAIRRDGLGRDRAFEDARDTAGSSSFSYEYRQAQARLLRRVICGARARHADRPRLRPASSSTPSGIRPASKTARTSHPTIVVIKMVLIQVGAPFQVRLRSDHGDSDDWRTPVVFLTDLERVLRQSMNKRRKARLHTGQAGDKHGSHRLHSFRRSATSAPSGI
jgi:hypothetical protein